MSILGGESEYLLLQERGQKMYPPPHGMCFRLFGIHHFQGIGPTKLDAEATTHALIFVHRGISIRIKIDCQIRATRAVSALHTDVLIFQRAMFELGFDLHEVCNRFRLSNAD